MVMDIMAANWEVTTHPTFRLILMDTQDMVTTTMEATAATVRLISRLSHSTRSNFVSFWRSQDTLTTAEDMAAMVDTTN